MKYQKVLISGQEIFNSGLLPELILKNKMNGRKYKILLKEAEMTTHVILPQEENIVNYMFPQIQCGYIFGLEILD